MRTLLVDNYDSFTYNLFDLLTQVNGKEPEVVTNDTPRPNAEKLQATYDSIVISPGPGNPSRAADVGGWGTVFECSELPILGVCLGHQSMCQYYGATVSAAPEPRHGRPSAIDNVGTGLFVGIPSPFTAIRYHSLAVSQLPELLEPIAWSRDGVVMGVRHRRLPQWGVQFHPESIGTEHGFRLIQNFAQLTADWHGTQWRSPAIVAQPPSGEPERPLVSVAPPAPSSSSAERPPARPHTHRVVFRSQPLSADPELLFATLFGASMHSFWLDSSSGGRFSFMGDTSGPESRVAVAEVDRRSVTITSAEGDQVLTRDFFDWLRDDLADWSIEAPTLPFDFGLGWVGYLGYELKAECGGDRAHRSAEPDAILLFADRAVAIDHHTGRLYLLALVPVGDEAAADDWFAETAARITALTDAVPASTPPAVTATEVAARHDAKTYRSLIDQCMLELHRGETYEVCLTNALSAQVTLDGWQTYRRLRSISPAPYSAYLRSESLSVLSTSPERFLRIDADGLLESKPIKGTRPRGRDAVEDAALIQDLRSNPKDRAENMMIVDLVRNDLGRSAIAGSVHVPHLFEVETYATVHQLVSTVRACKRADVSSVDAVRRAFPGGSMTGAPKIRTMQIIDRLEGGPRGIYSGAIGYFSLTGAVDLGMTIRTVVVKPESAGYGVGGAIITLSDPEQEVAETRTKAAVFARLLDRPATDLIPERGPAAMSEAPA
jgi:para-aminobenzoate synthetase